MGKNQRQVVFLFQEGNASAEVRGGKGKGLADMASLGLPIPPGFTLSTTVARAFSEHKRLPKRLAWQLHHQLQTLEQQTGKGFGNAEHPLLVSVRSGAAVSMPGMMDTVLNLGLDPNTVWGLAKHAGERFAFDCYRRFLAMFGEIVLGLSREHFEIILNNAKSQSGVVVDSELDTQVLQEVCEQYRALIAELTGRPVPDDPWEQLGLAILAVFRSWESERAVAYRSSQKIPSWMGTAVNVQAMVFGNHGATSGTGVVFSRNVATGAKGLYGEFLINAQGEDVVAGIRTPMPITEMKAWSPVLYAELDELVKKLEQHYGDVVDVEFTIEQGKLYLLQVRVAKRTAVAATTVAVHSVWKGTLTKEQALARVTPEQVEQLRRPVFDAEALKQAEISSLFAKGLSASPGAAVGKAVFTSRKAVEMANAGEKVVLIRPDTSPDDLPGMLKAVAVVTATGGATSHAAVVARGLGISAVVGASSIQVDDATATAQSAGMSIFEGDLVSVDGSTGQVFVGTIPFALGTQIKEVNIFLKWYEASKPAFIAEPQIGFEWMQEEVCANTILNDFYLSDAMTQASQGTALELEAVSLKNQVHQDTAEWFACYLAIAVAGELRWSWDKTESKFTRNAEQARQQLVARFDLRAGDSDDGDRASVQTRVVDCLEQLSAKEQAEFFELAAIVFYEGDWSSSYGGKKWGDIASAPMHYLKGQLTASVFVDHAFDLRHNGGTLFNKHVMVTANEENLHEQLEVKKHISNISDLRHKLSELMHEFSPRVQQLWEKGVCLGLWQAKAAPVRERRQRRSDRY